MKAKRNVLLAVTVGIGIGLAGCQSTGSVGAMLGTQGADTAMTKAAYMPVGQQVVPPIGYISFCLNDPSQCEGGTDTPTNMALTPERWTELNVVNDYVNSSVRQIEDIDNYGVSERWSYPNEKGGDCEDFALEKRKLLIERGWSPADLLIAVVREWNGAGHAILVVDTDKGEFVLDNKNWAIVAWNDTPYTWIKRQSRERPYIWVNLDTRTFRDAKADKLPPLGAPIPFVVAAQGRQAPAAQKAVAAAEDKSGLRPSLAATDAPQGPTAALAQSDTTLLR